MTQATISKFKISHAAADIEEVLELGGLGVTNSLIEVTNLDSPAGTREHIGGLADGTEISITCNYVSGATVQTALRADVDSQATAAFVLTYDNAITWSFNAVCMSWSIQPSVSEQNKISFSIKVTGAITEGTLP